MLRRGTGTPADEVARNQRERLFGAMIAVVSEKGYETTTVEDLIELSGVSRSDFYRHFENKQDCFVATVEAVVEATIASITRATVPAGEGRARKAFDALIELVVDQVAAARVCFVELHVAGAEAEKAAQPAFEAFERVIGDTLEQIPGREGMPPQIVRSMIGGVRKVIHTRLYRAEESSLPDLGPELWQWGLSYYPPPQELRGPRRRRKLEPNEFDGYTPEERICRATSAAIAERGYRATSVADIAERASISPKTFYTHFKNKEESTLAALDLGGAQLLGTVVPAARRARDWRAAVRAVYESMCSFFAAEPDFARLTIAEVYAAGPRALAERDRIIRRLQSMLAPGYQQAPATPAVTSEAIGGAIYALLYDQLRAGGPASLPRVTPLATYMTLTPFVGPYEAVVIANGGG